MNINDGFQTRDIVSIIRRRAPLATGVAGVAVLLSIIVAAILPNRYEAWTTLLVAPQTISKKLVEPGAADSDLNERLHLMTMQILSRGRLNKIIEEFKLYQKESQEMTREQVIDLMRDDIRVEPVFPELQGNRRGNEPLEINTFRLFYESRSPTIAANVASRLANDFIDEHIRERVEVSSDTSEFIEAELERLSAEIHQVEERITSVKNENAGSLPEDLDVNQRSLERTLSELRLAQRELVLRESDAAFYRQQAAVGAYQRYSFSEPDTPLERKQRLELALGESAARGLTDKHPDVIAYKEELADLETKILAAREGSEERQTPEAALAMNEAHRAEVHAEAAREEVGRLKIQADEIEGRVIKTPRVAEQLAELNRLHEHLYRSFQDFSNKRLEAGVSANMERRQKGEQFRVLEAAFPPPAASSPNRPVILLLGLLLGLAAGAGVALLREVADNSLHGPREIQATFQVPVLASIPRVLLEFDRARLRRKRILASVFAVGVATAGLMGAGAGYWLVNGPPGFLAGGERAGTAPDAAQQPKG